MTKFESEIVWDLIKIIFYFTAGLYLMFNQQQAAQLVEWGIQNIPKFFSTLFQQYNFF